MALAPEQLGMMRHHRVMEPSPGCSMWNGTCVAPYPGQSWQHPKIHTSPDCLHLHGWHDMAGALTLDGVHHAFQGCPRSLGWSHSVSTDLVHWKDVDRGVHTIHETYEGMNSTQSPCSGFVSVDDSGVPCAGFRQCGSTKGTTGLNPSAQPWDVPMELRCATSANMTEWGAPIMLFPLYYYRWLPYDPPRPWKDHDGKWYMAWSADGCNATTRRLPCAAGGQLELLVADTLRGPGSNWQQLPPLFTTNVTKSGAATMPGVITGEFVTSGYFGGVPGDPDGGATRVVTQNRYAPTFWVGRQPAAGKPFEAYWDKVGAVGHYDYGSLTMARTLGSDPNQVAKNGRRVLLGWIGGSLDGSQSLARDLSLSSDYELLQAFVPELQVLRQPTTYRLTSVVSDNTAMSVPHRTGSLQLELVASFSWAGSKRPASPFGITVLGGTTSMSIDCAGTNPQAPGGCMVTVDGASGPLMPLGTTSIHVHAIVDHEIVETIVNNRTAMVTYNKNISSPSSTAVTLFGTGVGGLVASLQSWKLTAANNLGPEPL